MQISVTDHPTPLVTVEGVIDHTTSREFGETLDRIAAPGIFVRLDLSKVDFIDSSGVGVLLEQAKAMQRRGTELRLQHFSRSVHNALFRIDLVKALGISCDDRQEETDDFMPAMPGSRWMSSCFSVPATPSAPAEIRNRISQLIADLPIMDTERDDIRLAVGEAATNAVKYGSKSPDRKVSVRCVVDDYALVIDISDSGLGFDRNAVKSPDFSDLPTSGMGIAIMEMVMDEVEFKTRRGTTVRMVKYLNSLRRS